MSLRPRSLRALPFAVVLLLAACTSETGTVRDAAASATAETGATASIAGHPGASAGAGAAAATSRSTRPAVALAAYPDRGDLVGYDHVRRVQRQGAHTFHAVRVSEAHALAAIGSGTLHFTAPDGSLIALRYERHVEHANGDWSWIGRDAEGIDGILTFGENAVFGVLPHGDDAPLRLTTVAGQAWVATTAKGVQSPLQQRINAGAAGPDYKLPPPGLAGARATGATAAGGEAPAAAGAVAAVGPAATTTIDVLLGYTAGFATMMGGTSQAQTRLNHLVTVGNQAFANSSVDVSLRLVGTLQVAYPDTGSNDTAVDQLTGSNGSSSVPVPASLQPLRAARETLGADLVSLVRRFRDPEHGGCGMAWLIGGGQTAIVPGHERFGYSVISDSNGMQAPDNGHYCRDETLVHELGHNLGSQHDEASARDDNASLAPSDYGRYPYSFGYKTDSAGGNFFTVMAYGDRGQTQYRIFSNPQSSYCGGRACGIVNRADNARSLRQTAPLIAGFRDSVRQHPPPDLFVIARNGSSGTEVHLLSGPHRYDRFFLQLPTALHRTGDGYDWAFRTADHNRDGVMDLYVIKKNGATGRTEVHVLDGATNFRTYLLQVATALHWTGGDNRWVFDVGDFNRDGVPDLYAVNRIGATGRTEVHVLDGASAYLRFLAQAATALHSTGTDLGWEFEFGDYDGDGAPDLYVVRRNGTNGRTEVHVLNGANLFQNFLLQVPTALHATGTADDWDHKLGDYDGDGQLDLYVIAKRGATGTEVHVLGGAGRFQSFLAHLPTPLHQTGTSGGFQFDLVGP